MHVQRWKRGKHVVVEKPFVLKISEGEKAD